MNLLEDGSGISGCDDHHSILTFLPSRGDNKTAQASITGTGDRGATPDSTLGGVKLILNDLNSKCTLESKDQRIKVLGKQSDSCQDIHHRTTDGIPERREILVMQFYVNLVFSE